MNKLRSNRSLKVSRLTGAMTEVIVLGDDDDDFEECDVHIGPNPNRPSVRCVYSLLTGHYPIRVRVGLLQSAHVKPLWLYVKNFTLQL